MKFLTWNVDGLCDKGLYERTQNSLAIILSQSPDLIFLQEVISPTEQIYSNGLLTKGYCSASPSPRGASYFTMCYYNPATIKLREDGCVRVQYTGEARSRMVSNVHCSSAHHTNSESAKLQPTCVQHYTGARYYSAEMRVPAAARA